MNIFDIVKNNMDYLDSLEGIETIYHYTNALGLKGILEDGNFNLSHAKFMNDKTEIIYTQKLIIKQLIMLNSKETNIEIKTIYKKFIEIMGDENKYTNEIESVKYRESKDRLPEYILSFSFDIDSQHMWSSFKCEDGYNIGIDFHKLYEKMNREGSILFIPSKVIYDVEKQKQKIKSRILEFINIAKERDIEEIKNFYIGFKISMRLFANFFKNPVFKNDKEFRIIIYIYKNSPIKPKYRVKNNILIPYVKAINYKNDDGDKLLPIKSVTIGPTNFSDIAEEGLTYYLTDIGYNIDSIYIEKSIIPLRY